MRTYVLINTSLENAGRIVTELRKRSGVLLVDIVNGPQPVIAVLESDDLSTIARAILFDIRRIEGVSDFTVYLSSDEHKNISPKGNMPGSLSPDRFKSFAGQVKRKSRSKRGKKLND